RDAQPRFGVPSGGRREGRSQGGGQVVPQGGRKGYRGVDGCPGLRLRNRRGRGQGRQDVGRVVSQGGGQGQRGRDGSSGPGLRKRSGRTQRPGRSAAVVQEGRPAGRRGRDGKGQGARRQEMTAASGPHFFRTANRIGVSARKPRSCEPCPTSNASVASRLPGCRAVSFSTRYSTLSPLRRFANGLPFCPVASSPPAPSFSFSGPRP